MNDDGGVSFVLYDDDRYGIYGAEPCLFMRKPNTHRVGPSPSQSGHKTIDVVNTFQSREVRNESHFPPPKR